MKGEFYKMDYEAWDTGTVDLPLELEAAYLRLCHQMYRTGHPVPNSIKLLQGLFRCGHIKAAALLRRLIEAGKIQVNEQGQLTNSRVSRELLARESLSSKRRVAGALGGTNSGVSGAKPLKNKEVDAAIALRLLTRGEEKREEKPPTVPQGTEAAGFEEFWSAYPERGGDNPRKPAAEAYAAAVRRGVTHAAIMAGIEAYRAELTEAQKIGTEFVAHAATWLREERFNRCGAKPQKTGNDPYLAKLADDDWREHMRRWKATGGQWTLAQKSEPPDSQQTKVPLHILLEFGIGLTPSRPLINLLTGVG
ncbi:DUF1376 domain-containing protein [Methylobacterium nigriterrae]|uniref:DUF1376 domain-containing protein n=1 Tax=Methylobacterium nigriterrae TaxID=3127512 RepID=UPI003013D79A